MHFQEYSHNDLEEEEEEEEEEEGDKPECPYGTSCYRKNPLHHKQYSHTKPPGTLYGKILFIFKYLIYC